MAERTTSPREWAIAVAGGLALAVVLVGVLRGFGPDEPVVELSAAPESVPESVPPSVPASVPESAPVSVPAAPPPAMTMPASAPPAPAPASGMTLRGLMVRPGTAASAIIEMSDGRQRLVRVGTGLGNGFTVETIDAGGVVITGAGGPQTLALPDSGVRIESTTQGGAGAVPLKALAATANDYRLATKPRKVGGRTTGFVITDVARLPAFRMAGMMPGDVLISVNGSGILSEEKLLEMPAEIAGAYAFDVVFERAGQQRRAVVKIEH